MLARLTRLGVVVVGLGIVLAWGCSQQSSKKESPTGGAGPGAKQVEPAGKPATPPAETKPVQEKPEKPAATEPSPEAKPGEETPEKPEEPAAAPDSTDGRAGKAVGRVLKRLMEEKPAH